MKKGDYFKISGSACHDGRYVATKDVDGVDIFYSRSLKWYEYIILFLAVVKVIK